MTDAGLRARALYDYQAGKCFSLFTEKKKKKKNN